MKIAFKVKDIEENEYCIVEQYEYIQMENSPLDIDGFYGYTQNDKFIPSSKRKHLNPWVLFVEGDSKKLNLKK